MHDHPPRHIKGLFCDRVPPFAARADVTSDRVRLVGGVSFRGVSSIGAALVFAGVGVWWTLTSRTFDPIVWIFVVPAAGFLVWGIVLCARPRESLEIDKTTGRVTVHGTRDIAPSGVAIMLHAVELHRPKRWHPWKGFALCAWQEDELLMVLAVSKDREFCTNLLREGDGELEAMFQGDGPLLLGYLM